VLDYVTGLFQLGYTLVCSLGVIWVLWLRGGPYEIWHWWTGRIY